MKRLILSVLCPLIILATAGRAFGADRFVASTGSDNGPGAKDKPFATITKARDALRELKSEGAKRIVIQGGSYYDVVLELGAQDSGLTIEAAPGEKPILYGGRPVRNWEKDGDRYYAAPWPAGPEVRLLQVNGAMRPRARLPAEGAFTHLSTFDVRWMSSTGGGWQRKPTAEELTTLKYKSGEVSPALDVRNAEITVFHMWDESCVGVASNDIERQMLIFNTPAGHPAGAFGVKKYVVWNVREGLTAPGEWYHDRTRNKIVYWPLPDEDLNKMEAIAPTQTTIVRLRGAKGVTLRGLTLAVTTVPLKAAGFGAAQFDGAISLANTENCGLENLTVTRVAGHGINAPGNCTGTRVVNCEVSHCGAGGIYVGGSGATITDNHVHAIGLSYPSGIGIFRGGKGNVVAHNEVHDCTYSAINYGGDNNRIEDNLLYDCMKVLHDGAAIYLFGAKNCVIRRNLARDIVDTGGYGASAYYLDEQSTGCVVEDNVAVRVNWPSHNHMAHTNTIRHNVFIVEGDAKLTFPRSDGFTVEQNVVYATGKITITNPDGVVRWSSNIFHSATGMIEGVKLKDYSATGKITGPLGDTLLTDPLFVDWQHGDCRYRADSPARKLGLAPLDFSKAGRRRK